ncbi:MAG: hypothetical protein LBD15_02425 [Holosporales bacterium]|jgi:hypothetical protein|nr:hypothetical protein [Holosporales bacterium]
MERRKDEENIEAMGEEDEKRKSNCSLRWGIPSSTRERSVKRKEERWKKVSQRVLLPIEIWMNKRGK